MRQAILERPGRQRLVLPAPKEHFDVLPLERAGSHLPKARLAQLTACQRERSQPVRLCGMAAVAVALAEHPQRVRQIIHRKLSYRLLSSERNPVSVIANSQSEIPRRDKGQVLSTPVASNEASVVLPAGRSDGPTAKDERGY